MPTTVTKTVKSAGGDYSTISAWEAGQQGDLVAADEIRQAEVYAFNDTTVAVIAGSTTDATRYLRVYVKTGEGHAGYWDTTKFWMSQTNPTNGCISITDLFVRVEGIQFQTTYNTTGLYVAGIGVGVVASATNDIRVGYCLFKGITSGGSGENFGVFIADSSNGWPIVSVYNCVAFDFYDVDFPDSPIGALVANYFGFPRIYNCTAHNCGAGILYDYHVFGDNVIRNCAAFCWQINAFFVDYSTTATYTNCRNNSSGDGTAPGTNSTVISPNPFLSETSTSAFFLDIGPTPTLRNVGMDDPASGIFSDDIRRRPRVSTWDIGANEYTDSSPRIQRPGKATSFFGMIK